MPVGMVLFGFIVMWSASRDSIGQKLAPSLVGVDVVGIFEIVDFPKINGKSVSLLVEPVGRADLPRKIRLGWYDSPLNPEFGECWSLSVRLRRPRGFSNPAGFDYEGWLFREGIGSTGYVRRGEKVLSCDRMSGMSRLRKRIAERISAILPDDDATAVILAITVGARHEISPAQWQQYAITGTSHLMAISGLHIGLAAGGGFLLSWLFLALCHRSGNLRDQAAVAGFLVAVLYCVISGFALPARRALSMLALVLATALMRRELSPVKVLSLTCIAMTIADPLSIMTPGFQLSFAAVAILFWRATFSQRREKSMDGQRLRRRLLELVPLQFVLFLGLLPLTVLHFGRVAWLSPVANLLVIPVFNLVVVPASLVGLVMSGPLAPAGDLLLKAAWYSVDLLLRLIAFAADFPFSEQKSAQLDGVVLATAWLAALWAILPASWPGRHLAWIAGLWVLTYSAPRPPDGCVDVHSLDVGQGLATVVVTSEHTLVFDAGPSFRSGSDTGLLVVAPFLAALGIKDVDLLVVSHADNDHAGGVRSLTEAVRIERVLSGEYLPALELPQAECSAGQSRHWDAVDFAVIHPAANAVRDGNNASCVMEIRTGQYAILMTGDIELAAERKLVSNRRLSPVNMVHVPHHGSRTSSHPSFVAALRPQIALVSAGYENQWGFPKDDVVDRWRAVGAQVLNTATSGAISYRMCEQSGLERLNWNRVSNRRVWHD